MEQMLPLKGTDGYFVQGFNIIGKFGRALKPDRRKVYRIMADDKKPLRANLNKLVWCARRGIDVRQVPRDYSFRNTDTGWVEVETFSNRMSRTRQAVNKAVKMQREDYDFIERFAHTALSMIDGEPDAKLQLFTLLNSKRDECIRYARTASGGVSQEKAVLYTDTAIAKVYEQLLARNEVICSPIASIKWYINHQIKTGRKHRNIQEWLDCK